MIIFAIGMVLISVIIFSIFFFGPDNIIEEIGEKYFYDKTGIDIDFTPSSVEPLT